MGFIAHCGGLCNAKKYVLNPRDKSLHDYDHVYEGSCDKCGQFVMEVCPFTFLEGEYPRERIIKKEHDEWRQRILLHRINDGQMVSDCTAEMCRDVADTYQQVIARFGGYLREIGVSV